MTPTIPLDFIWQAIAGSSTIHKLRSYDHGPGHWARVRNNGIQIGKATEQCDLLVVEFFALFHDTMRENEFSDPEHGQRGAKLAWELGVETFLTPAQYATFETAVIFHDAGTTHADPTVGTCWDADRLDLPRVGITPDPMFFSTDAGKALLAKS